MNIRANGGTHRVIKSLLFAHVWLISLTTSCGYDCSVPPIPVTGWTRDRDRRPLRPADYSYWYHAMSRHNTRALVWIGLNQRLLSPPPYKQQCAPDSAPGVDSESSYWD